MKRMTRSVLALPRPLAIETWAANRPLDEGLVQAAIRYLPMVMGVVVTE
jgi:hypothetical protein